VQSLVGVHSRPSSSCPSVKAPPRPPLQPPAPADRPADYQSADALPLRLQPVALVAELAERPVVVEQRPREPLEVGTPPLFVPPLQPREHLVRVDPVPPELVH